MNWRIQTYRREFVPGICRAFNREVEGLDFIVPLHEQRFIELVEQKSYFEPDGFLVATAADQPDEVLGWAHGCVAGNTEVREGPGTPLPRVEMVIFPRRDMAMGMALGEELTRWLKTRSEEQVTALHPYHGYPFYRGLWLGGEPQMPLWLPHVQACLADLNFETSHEDLILVARMDSPPRVFEAHAGAVEYVSLAAPMAHELMRESWIGFEPQLIRAMLGMEVAAQIGWVLIPQTSEGMGAVSMNIYNLWTQDKYRRQGLAAALVSRAMHQAYAQGARWGNVCTQVWNAPAQATYGKCGLFAYGMVNGRTLRAKNPGT
ncbi:MAG: GNAT family N-acetyltransferase [Phycisphaeraceae bacterium]|nr:GNAT family N-acetyltransferase [Phycisphaeraceae bacterium]